MAVTHGHNCRIADATVSFLATCGNDASINITSTPTVVVAFYAYGNKSHGTDAWSTMPYYRVNSGSWTQLSTGNLVTTASGITDGDPVGTPAGCYTTLVSVEDTNGAFSLSIGPVAYGELQVGLDISGFSNADYIEFSTDGSTLSSGAITITQTTPNSVTKTINARVFAEGSISKTTEARIAPISGDTGWINAVLDASVTNEDDVSGWNWLNPQNTRVNSGLFAGVALSGSAHSDYIRTVGFGLTATQIPSGYQIDGIQVRIKKYVVTSATETDRKLYLRDSTGQVGDSKADLVSQWNETASYITYGTGTTDTWNAGLTQADVIAATFGVDFSAMAGASAVSLGVDHIQIRLYFSPPATPESITRTVNARVKIVESITRTVNARVKRTFSITKTTDAKVKWVKSVTKTVDARVKIEEIVTRTVDARVKRVESVTKTVDASVINKNSITKTVDARVIGHPFVTKTVDARVLDIFSITKTTDARVLRINSITKTVDAKVKWIKSITKTVNARVFNTYSITKTVDARILDVFSITKTTDARVKRIFSITKTIDANVTSSISQESITKTVDARIFNTYSITKTVDARILDIFSIIKTVDARIVRAFSITKTIDANVTSSISQESITKTVDARIVGTLSITKTIDVKIKWIESITKDINARVVRAFSITSTADARVLRIFSISSTADARVIRHPFITKTVDARILDVFSITKTTDARVLRVESITKTINARMKSTLSNTKTIDVRVLGVSTPHSITKTLDLCVIEYVAYEIFSVTRKICKIHSVTKPITKKITVIRPISKTISIHRSLM